MAQENQPPNNPMDPERVAMQVNTSPAPPPTIRQPIHSRSVPGTFSPETTTAATVEQAANVLSIKKPDQEQYKALATKAMQIATQLRGKGESARGGLYERAAIFLNDIHSGRTPNPKKENPISNLFRIIADEVRSPREAPVSEDLIAVCAVYLATTERKELSTMIVPTIVEMKVGIRDNEQRAAVEKVLALQTQPPRTKEEVGQFIDEVLATITEIIKRPHQELINSGRMQEIALNIRVELLAAVKNILPSLRNGYRSPSSRHAVQPEERGTGTLQENLVVAEAQGNTIGANEIRAELKRRSDRVPAHQRTYNPIPLPERLKLGVPRREE